MNRYFMGMLVGLGLGIIVGYQSEEEIDDFCRQSKKMKKKMMKQVHHFQDYLD